MLFKDRKELANKYKIWVKQSIDNNQTMILDCAESLIAFLDLNGYLNKVIHGEWVKTTIAESCGTDELHRTMYRDRETVKCSKCGNPSPIYNIKFEFCPHCGADMRGGREDDKG